MQETLFELDVVSNNNTSNVNLLKQTNYKISLKLIR